MQNDNTKSIVATNLWDMLVEVQSCVKQGYVLSDENQYYPQSFIGLYTCTMVPENETGESLKEFNKEAEKVIDILNKIEEEIVADVTTPAKKSVGRKPKVS